VHLAATALVVSNPRNHVIHASGISWLAILGVVGTLVGIIAFTIQVNDVVRRRKFKRAGEALMEAIQANQDIASVRRELRDLSSQIEVEIPRQAREAYLKERLQQVELVISGAYREYRSISDELVDAPTPRAWTSACVR
jgi:uncharacterized membrane protein YhiD involved in acid resistance